MAALLADLLADLLAVGHPGSIQLGLNAEAALQLAHQHVNLDVARAGDNDLMGLGVVDHVEGGVLLVEADKAGAHLLILTPGLGGDGAGIAGLRKRHGGQLYHALGVAQGLAGLQAVHLGDGADVAAGDLFDFLVLLALDGIQAAQLLGLAGVGVIKGHVAGNLTGDDLHQGILAVLVGDGLEDDGGSGAVGVALDLDGVLAGLVRSFLGGHLQGGGNQVNDGGQKHLGAQARQGGAADHGGQGALSDADLQAFHDLVLGEGLALEEFLHLLIAGLGHGLHQLAIQLVQNGLLAVGDGNFHPLGALLVLGHLVGLAVDDVDDADGALIAVPDGSHHGGDGFGQLLTQGGQGLGEVGVFLVLLGYVDDAGLVLALEIFPAALRAHAESVLGGAHQYAHLGGPDTGLHLSGKIEVARGVHHIDLHAVVHNGRHGEGNGDLTLDLLGIVITNGVAVRRLAQAVGNAGEIQHTLHQRGFSAAAVTQQADVANVHRVSSPSVYRARCVRTCLGLV